ncbi:MAG: PstS family phosphate ABC transporter substrate-binding protein [Armatimonadetes bacterium]|nr:PstS family phosphate ABC transporter substrate-binding protein [Armatimonadota bacterium]
MNTRQIFWTAIATCALLGGCGPSTSGSASSSGGSTGGGAKLTGTVDIDGSSTVGPIMQAMAEEFGKSNPDVKVTVGISGTGGGFKKFSSGEIDIADASRPIEEKEIAACKEKGIEFIELPVAFDGLSVVVNSQNDFLEDITVAELKSVWSPDSTVKTWDQVRAGFPKEPIKLYGAGTDSGTFDYFTKAINGKEKASRSDYQASEDDNTLVQGVAGDKFALGYFGYAYYEQNKDKLKLLKVNGVAPSPETINDGTYQPLSRPLFIYVNKKSLDEKPQVKELVKLLLTGGKDLIRTVGYVPLSDEDYKSVEDHMNKGTTGTVFRGAETGIKIKDVLSGSKSK